MPIFTSDGLNLYFYALSAHFGQWISGVGPRARQWQVLPGMIYGQVTKIYRRRKVVRVTNVMRCGMYEELRAALCALGLSGRLNTAFVERVNLTIRQGVAALARRTWATAQAAPSLLAYLEWWRGYYHLCGRMLPCACPLPNQLSEAGDGCRSATSSARQRWQQD